MPGFVTHHIYGVLAYKELQNSDIKKIIKNHHSTYSLGLQGPDLFFYFPLTAIGPLPNIANLMHKKRTGDFFRALIDGISVFSEDEDYEIAYAYIMGYMGHYLLDTTVHPYVYSRVGITKDSKTIGVHFGLETDIDREVLKHYKGLELTDFAHDKVVRMTPREKKVVARLLSIALLKTYGINMPERINRLAIGSFEICSGLLMDKHTVKYRIIHFFERIFLGYELMSPLLINSITHSTDCMNTAHNSWSNPYKESPIRHESVYELIDNNIGRYCSYMQEMHHALADAKNMVQDDSPVILQMLGNLSFTTGLDCRYQL